MKDSKESKLRKCYFQIVWSENIELHKMSIENICEANSRDGNGVTHESIRFTREAPVFTYNQLESLLHGTNTHSEGYDKTKLCAFEGNYKPFIDCPYERTKLDRKIKGVMTGRYDISNDSKDSLTDAMGWY